MAKQFAHKKTRMLKTQQEITQERLNSGEFSPSWQGRFYVLNAKKSRIAQEMGIEYEGEYAIKVR